MVGVSMNGVTGMKLYVAAMEAGNLMVEPGVLVSGFQQLSRGK
jgi:hypothetical protein